VRKDFVANASHELKTPVAAILGASETLSDGAANDPVAGPRFLDVIARHASRLAALVDDLLDLSRLEARPTEAMREVPAADALSRAAAAFRESAASKRIDLQVDPPARDTIAVRGDPALMDRALTNLVQNAVRYTAEGGRVRLRALEVHDGVRFEVEDTGIGIPPQALPRIFERFYRVDPARSRELGGTGLGLAIVKHAVESMGGTVAVRSVPDHGSTFSFTLPAWHEPV
jgi:two-component system phosphate regulon sensor histidine kinase PhoR